MDHEKRKVTQLWDKEYWEDKASKMGLPVRIGYFAWHLYCACSDTKFLKYMKDFEKGVEQKARQKEREECNKEHLENCLNIDNMIGGKEWADKIRTKTLEENAEAIAFFEHLKNHKEVQEAPIYKGIPVCRICGKPSTKIFEELTAMKPKKEMVKDGQ